MGIGKFIFVVFLHIFCVMAFAATPESALRRMVERDMAGDPSARVDLAAPNASVIVSSNRQLERSRIAFELDSDAIELAIDWRIEEKPQACSTTKCVISVVYRVVATTTGRGVPSWNRVEGREIEPLSHPVERSVKYELVRIGSDWKIRRFPVPYVMPKVVKEFFISDMAKAESVTLPTTADERALRNRQIIKAWRERQLEALNI